MSTIVDTLTKARFIKDVHTYFKGLTRSELGAALDGCDVRLGDGTRKDYYYKFGGSNHKHSNSTAAAFFFGGRVIYRSGEVETTFRGFSSQLFESNQQKFAPVYTMHYKNKSFRIDDIEVGCSQSRKWKG